MLDNAKCGRESEFEKKKKNLFKIHKQQTVKSFVFHCFTHVRVQWVNETDTSRKEKRRKMNNLKLEGSTTACDVCRCERACSKENRQQQLQKPEDDAMKTRYMYTHLSHNKSRIVAHKSICKKKKTKYKINRMNEQIWSIYI